MRFKHGSQFRGSRCIIVVLLIGATVNILGSRFSIGQETSKSGDNFTESFTVGIALRKIEAAGHDASKARQLLQERILNALAGAHLKSNNEVVPSIRLQDDRLHVEGSHDYIDVVKRQLIQVEQFGLSQIQYSIVIVEVATEEANSIVEKWTLAGRAMVSKQETNSGLLRKSGVVPTSFTKSAATTEIRVADVLSNEQIDELLNLGKVIAAPKIVAQNGTEATVQVGREMPFVAAYERVKDDEGNATVQPKVGSVLDGIKLDLTGILDDKKQNVQLALRLTHSHLNEMKSLACESEDGPVTVQQPDFTSSEIQTTCNALANKTIGLCSGPTNRESIVEHAVPLVSRVPYVGKAFKNSRKITESITTIVLIRCEEHEDTRS